MRSAYVTVGLLVFISLGFIGCGPREQALKLSEATLEGTITYQGKAVPHALVVVTDTKQSAQGFADANGKYRVESCPAGSVQVAVNTDAGKGNMMSAVMAASKGGNQGAAPTFVDVPSKYFDPATSGIQTTVGNEKGSNSFDIKLE